MSNVAIHERPGVYSEFDASSIFGAAKARGVIGVAAAAASGTAGKVETLSSEADGLAVFGEDTANAAGMSALVKVLYENGAGTVKAVRVSDETEAGYDAAFRALENEEDVTLLICGSTEAAVELKMKESAERASLVRCERVAVAASDQQQVSEMTARAAALNSERVVLVCGKLKEGGSMAKAAAALAAAIACGRDPSLPVNGAVLSGTDNASGRFSDSEIDAMVTGGVTAVENLAGVTSVVRAVTTRTKTNDAPDSAWRELTTVLIADDVIPSVRAVLKKRFARSKNTAQTRGAIRSQILMELENKLARQIIDGYGEVTVSVAAEDPTLCEAEFSFAVTHGLSRIYLTAHIAV